MSGVGNLREVGAMDPTSREVAVFKRAVQRVGARFVHHLHRAAGRMAVFGGDSGREHLDLFHGVRAALDHAVHLVHHAGVGRLGRDAVQGRADVVLRLPGDVEAGLAQHADHAGHVLQQVHCPLHDARTVLENLGGKHIGAHDVFGVQQRWRQPLTVTLSVTAPTSRTISTRGTSADRSVRPSRTNSLKPAAFTDTR